MPKSLPRGVVASSVTPFARDGRPDLPAIKPHIDWLISEEVSGLSPLGSAGEFFSMESADRKRVLEAVIQANDGRVPVMAGTHHYNTAITIDLSKHAQAAGADSLLIVPPYYAGATNAAVMDHYRRIAESVSIPIVLYHNSVGTGVDLSTADVKALHDEGAIAGVKFSNMLPDRLVELMQATAGRLPVYAGIDFVAFEALCHGGYGWISGIPSIVPKAANALYRAIAEKGDLTAARDQWTRLAPLMRFIFETRSNPANGAHWLGVMKSALNMTGPYVGEPLPPSGSINAEERRRLATMLRALGYQTKDI